MIEKELILKIARENNCDIKNLLLAFMTCDGKGFLDMSDLLQMTESGLNVMHILSNTMNLSSIKIKENIDSRCITYNKLLFALKTFFKL